jgi:hypothetical protein
MVCKTDVIADVSYPCEAFIREAHRLADRLGPKSRSAIEALLFAECRDVLGAGDRQEWIDNFLEGRADRQQRLLEGLGLVRQSPSPDHYAPGTWRLTVEAVAGGHVFIISGIRSSRGDVMTARLSAKEFTGAAMAWRAIARALGLDARMKPPTTAWYRLWLGFPYQDSRGQAQWAKGVKTMLMEEHERRMKEDGNATN